MGYIAEGFFHWGLWASKRPLISILIGLCLVIIGFCGFINSQTTADPQELWVPPASRANVEQEYFNEEFGAFYRIDTAWIVPNYPADANNDLFQKEYLNLVYYLQTAITYGEAQLNGMNFTLDDFCYKPISGEGCIVESPMQYFKSDPEILNNPDTNVKVTA
jgi:Niemann-Pick C1 protein